MLSQEQWASAKRFITLSNGDHLAFIEQGNRQCVTVLFIHGLSDSSRSFSLMDSHMSGFHRIMLDLPSHGSSAAGSATPSIEGYANVVTDFVRSQKLHKPLLIGHSLGAMVGCHAAATLGNEISGLVCINGAAKPAWSTENALITAISAMPDPIDPMDEFFDAWHATFQPVCDQFLSYVRTEASMIPKSVWLSLLQSIANADLARAAESVFVPARIIFGCSDHLFDSLQQELLAKWLDADAIVTLPASGHNPHWDEPQRTAEVIKAFAQAVQGKGKC